MKRIAKQFESKVLWLASGLVLVLALSGCGLTRAAREAKSLDLGKKYFAKKDYNRAAIEFQNAIRLQKKDAEPYYQLGLTYIAMADFPAAHSALAKALEMNPKHQQARIKDAELMASLGYEEGVLRKAEAMAREVLANTPNEPDALNALAVAEWKLGDRPNAEMDFARALSQAPQNLQASLNLAKVKFYQKDLAGAEEVLKKAVKANPNSAAPLSGLGQLYLAAGKPESAEQQFRSALQIDPKNDLALISLATLYANTKRTDLAEQAYRQLSALPDAKYKPVHAMFLFQSGKRDQAVAEFEKLMSENPSNRRPRTRLIEAYFAMNRVADAERVLSAALRKNGKDIDALLQRSRIYLLSRNYAAAQRDVDQVLRFSKDDARPHYVMAKIKEGLSETLNQRQELSEAIRLDKYFLPARLELAGLMLRTNAATAALDVLNEAPDSQKTEIPVILQRNWALWELGNMAELRKGIDQGLARERAPGLLVQDGLWKMRGGQYTAGVAALDEALKGNPADVRGLAALYQAYVAQKQPATGLKKVQEYASRPPQSAPAQQFLGIVLAANGDRKGARAAFVAAKKADPRFEPADLSLVQLDVVEKKMDDAQKRLEAVLSNGSGNATARLWLATIADKQGHYDTAIENFRKVVDANPNNAQALNNLAYLLSEHRKQPDEALKYAHKAVELAPDNPAYCDTLGWTLYRKGLWEPAIQYLQRASADKSNVVWKYHLAMAYAKSGKIDLGRTTLKSALELNPNVPVAKIAQQVVGSSH